VPGSALGFFISARWACVQGAVPWIVSRAPVYAVLRAGVAAPDVGEGVLVWFMI